MGHLVSAINKVFISNISIHSKSKFKIEGMANLCSCPLGKARIRKFRPPWRLPGTVCICRATRSVPSEVVEEASRDYGVSFFSRRDTKHYFCCCLMCVIGRGLVVCVESLSKPKFFLSHLQRQAEHCKVPNGPHNEAIASAIQPWNKGVQTLAKSYSYQWQTTLVFAKLFFKVEAGPIQTQGSVWVYGINMRKLEGEHSVEGKTSAANTARSLKWTWYPIHSIWRQQCSQSYSLQRSLLLLTFTYSIHSS